MVIYVRQLPAKEKLKLYKKIKGWCLFEGWWNVNAVASILDEKVKDVTDILDYEMAINPMEVYKDHVNGRIR